MQRIIFQKLPRIYKWRKILELVFDILRTWKRILVFLGLEIFAYFVGIKFIFLKNWMKPF